MKNRTFHVVYWDPKQDTERELVIVASSKRKVREHIRREHGDASPEITSLDDEEGGER